MVWLVEPPVASSATIPFTTTYNHPLQEGQYPAERLVAGECFSDVVVEVAKLDVHSRGEAIVWARERGFAPEPRNGNGRK